MGAHAWPEFVPTERHMAKNVAINEHFERFIDAQVAAGRFNDDSEVVRAGLRLLEERELKLGELRAAIEKGDDAFAEGRYHEMADPAALANDIIARGQLRTKHRATR